MAGIQSYAGVDRCVNVQLIPFIAVVVLGIVLIREPQQAAAGVLVLPVLAAAGRRSTWFRRRVAGRRHVWPAVPGAV
ncbi:hypothetical protein OHA84_36730 [Streptomyces sp. NBC_00513]|uniref:hypothetical protein n=1 Tax=unclassified Streptomyces TaxID=2593676 RepID=UPI002254EEB5|nr:hypothetical protein [Streptomyces sp. NBC_00424]MCX5078677.1 hypothetical protein [Streptomyces sp. NBC_00424]WUD39120.1 hypothetical protein OHA84_00570 [Streptomyces sp. NBC_00513]WUD45609.1 hypothetical protein OHA84_36730 [Streptomyces sp. NBC_00513]